jgi:hypothetical protein
VPVITGKGAAILPAAGGTTSSRPRPFPNASMKGIREKPPEGTRERSRMGALRAQWDRWVWLTPLRHIPEGEGSWRQTG